MQRIGSVLVLSPSDLNHFLECEYLTHLDLEVVAGRVIEERRDPEADLLAAKGDAHERLQLARFTEEGRDVAIIPDPASELGWTGGEEATRAAMGSGAGVIYQAVLVADGWRGRADFLVRVESPSALGAWSYEVWDTKLARHAKPSHILQLAYYTERISTIQGAEPQWMQVVLGTGERVRFRTRDFVAYFNSVRSRFVRGLGSHRHAVPYPVSHCALCGYGDHCEERWDAEDHLCLVAGIRRNQVDRLQEAGISTCAELAASTSTTIRISEATLLRLRHQAELQTSFRTTGVHRYQLLPLGRENGFRLLPEPSPGDIFFDMEGFPFFDAARGLEYLFGALVIETGQPAYHAFQATDRESEKRAFEQFVDFAWERLQRWPDLHIYHYAHYETTALKRLMSEHATREEEVDELLRREVFVDLFQIVRRSMRISHDNYSIKSVRQFFMADAGKGEVTGGAQSIVEFQRWLDTGDRSILGAIERYNEEDCVSTVMLRNWLLERRREAEALFGEAIPFCPLSKQRELPVAVKPDENRERRAGLQLLGDDWARTLAHLLDYHRREAKPEWWAYFQRRKKSLDELIDDTEAVAYLGPCDDPPVPQKRSLVHALEFPPQEFKLKADAKVEGPLGEGPAGTLEWIDASAGRLGLRRDKTRSEDPLPAAVIAGSPVDDKAQRAAIARVADSVLSGSRRYAAVLDILQRVRPRLIAPRSLIQTLDLDEQKQLVAKLDDSYLFVQGPPGTGKTWIGARLIVSLLAAGKRVGVAGPSHRAIHNLLEEVERVAAEEGVEFRGVKKRSTSGETAFEGRFITSLATNEEVESCGAQLIAGTAWMFAREEFDQSIDCLFIDEAGQFALADAVAVGTAAGSIILLGDPQQLPHVAQNTHPDGSGASVLEHLLGDAATVAEDRGLFLANTWRMHPDVCRFVSEHSYDGRLGSAPGCEHQTVVSPGLCGAGLRYVSVDHRHNAQQSPEEAETIAREVRLLLQRGAVTDRHGVTRPLVPSDILVVAPYNMQVRCLRDVLPADVEVGTVDKFQGREAAVVFFSMASSSSEDVPRGLEFLFNSNRFNVAVSRAKCLSVVVCSPRLLEARCRTVEQMRLVNALCRFVEIAPRVYGSGPSSTPSLGS